MEDILLISHGERLTKADMAEGNRPFVGASDSNNGVTEFVDNDNSSIDSNVLGVNYNGSVCCAFYHPYEALFSDDVKRVRWKEEAANNKYTLLYLSAVIAKQKSKYAYGYKFNTQRMRRQLLLLPTTPDGAPDWAFMSAYMRRWEEQLLADLLPRIEAMVADVPSVAGTIADREWRTFLFSELFTKIQRGKRLKKDDHITGDVPYVSSTAANNGIDGFVGNDYGVRIFSHCITLANSGSVGSAFFHTYAFVASDHVTSLERQGLDAYAYFFLLPVISKLSEKYSFNREINDERIAKERLLLPATPDGLPDWAFMSAYMQRIEQEGLRQVLAFFHRGN